MLGCGRWAVGCGLWGERSIRSVAHLTRADGQAVFEAIRQAPPRTEVRVFPLEQANEALEQWRALMDADQPHISPLGMD